MIQELITYTIVVVAAAVAIYLMVKKVAGRKHRLENNDPAADCTDKSACGGCAADCIMRSSSQRPADS